MRIFERIRARSQQCPADHPLDEVEAQTIAPWDFQALHDDHSSLPHGQDQGRPPSNPPKELN